MTIYIIEHEQSGYPMFETIRGVEDINLDDYAKGLTTFWVCDNEEEVTAVEDELRRKHARSSQQP
jgi:hypothetical protein